MNPCSLLTPTQVEQRELSSGDPGSNSDGLGSLDCGWASRVGRLGSGWVARAITKHGADYFLDSVTGAQIVEVGGFPAVRTTSPHLPADKQCLLYIDVAPGQSLAVAYESPRGDLPAIGHELACRQAGEVATVLLANLRAGAR